MALGINTPRIVCHRNSDGTYTATLYIEGRWWAARSGYISPAAARRDMRKTYL